MRRLYRIVNPDTLCEGPEAVSHESATQDFSSDTKVIAIRHPRGSAAARVIDYLAEHGETPGTLLARYAGFDNSALRGITRHAIEVGLIAFRKDRDDTKVAEGRSCLRQC